jgi:hypothetical protein
MPTTRSRQTAGARLAGSAFDYSTRERTSDPTPEAAALDRDIVLALTGRDEAAKAMGAQKAGPHRVRGEYSRAVFERLVRCMEKPGWRLAYVDEAGAMYLYGDPYVPHEKLPFYLPNTLYTWPRRLPPACPTLTSYPPKRSSPRYLRGNRPNLHARAETTSSCHRASSRWDAERKIGQGA